MKYKIIQCFDSHMTRNEYIFSIGYILMHMLVLPILLGLFLYDETTSLAQIEFILLAIGFALMLIFMLRFLKREFYSLIERPFRCILEVITGYLTMVCLNFLVGSLLIIVFNETANPNNDAIMQMAADELRYTKTMCIFFAPVVEEIMFRGGVFGLLYRRSRRAAYIVSALLFSFFHVWEYLLIDIKSIIYIIQYIPVSLLLARAYERTNSIWTSIFFHMLVNAMSLSILLIS